MSTINVNNVIPVTGNTVNINGVTITDGVLSATTYENIPNFDFTGGTVSGATEFVGGLTANTVSATTYENLPNFDFTGGTISGSTEFLGGLSATTISATTYENLPNFDFTGGTVSGATEFLSGLTADTIFANTFYGDGSNLTGITGITNFISVTYSELVDMISGGTLSNGSFYSISDFRTCYDRPEYYADGSMKLSGATTYVEGAIEALIVLATSENTISTTAYQPTYPNDRIKYDWTWNQTEISLGAAFGRITERIDEFNNRTDYDHRNIEFIRFAMYDKGFKISGYITAFDCNTGILTGVDSLFLSEVSNNEIIYFEWQNGLVGVRVISTSTDTQLVVVVDPTFTSINFENGSIPMYRAVNQEYYGDYKEAYIGQYMNEDFATYPTFNLDGTATNNYIDDYSRFYINGVLDSTGFLLANNVFYSETSNIYSNKIGVMSYNNNFTFSFRTNTIGDRFYNNVGRQNSFIQNIIGNSFHNNKIINTVNDNVIRDSFYDNIIVSSFYDNEIGNYVYGNEFYSRFHDNKVGDDFYDNIIGDSGNLTNFRFRRNVIGDEFNNNKIRQRFQNNNIGRQFQYNVINGYFNLNVIGDGFGYNENIGYDFSTNNIGNYFSNNQLIGDYFKNNKIGESFENNSISYRFQNNQINNNFYNNTLGDKQYFSWDNVTIGNLTGRTYSTFYNSLYGNGGESIGNVILGKELIMHDIVNNEYHKVKFTQWTQQGDGGGFSYERTLIWPTQAPTVYFTKTNYGSEVDVIYSGSVEITRGDNGGIYNSAVESDWNSNSSPANTEWNSIYTQPNNGSNFQDNEIDNEFKGNYIRNEFSANEVGSYVGANDFSGNTYDNSIGSYTFSNDFKGYISGNKWGNGFGSNIIGDGFIDNTIGNEVYGNILGNNFSSNEIKNYFTDNNISDNFGHGNSEPQGNKIGNNFEDNNIAEYFYNNIIPDNFILNTIGDYFQWNVVKTDVRNFDFTQVYGNITAFTYTSVISGITDNTFNNVVGTTNHVGVGASFNFEISGNTVIGVSGNTQGKLFVTGDTVTINGNQMNGRVGAVTGFTSDAIGKSGVTGTYNNIFATGTDNGEGVSFDITVTNDLVDGFLLNDGGSDYIVGQELFILGSDFGGVDGVDDINIVVQATHTDEIIITITGVSPKPSVYEEYTSEIFERKGGLKRLSFYDENDILNITNINE